MRHFFITRSEPSRRLAGSYIARPNILESPSIFVVATETGLTEGSKYAIRILEFFAEVCYFEYGKDVKT